MASRSQRQQARRAAASAGNPTHGGTREGSPNTSYANRSDLNQPVRAAPGLPYGQAQAAVSAQQVLPLPDQAGQLEALAPSQPDPRQAQAQALGAQMASAPGLTDPTQRPSEPVTTGIAGGPGAGPSSLVGPVAQSLGAPADIEGFLRALVAQSPTPNPDVERLLVQLTSKKY